MINVNRVKVAVTMNLSCWDAILTFVEWSGYELEEFIEAAVLERLRTELNELAGYGIPKAIELYNQVCSIVDGQFQNEY